MQLTKIFHTFVDSAGSALAGKQVRVFKAGVSTPQSLYTVNGAPAGRVGKTDVNGKFEAYIPESSSQCLLSLYDAEGNVILAGAAFAGDYSAGGGSSLGYTPPEVLTTDRTIYVRKDGSDSNNGLANTAAGAFLTVQKAVDAAYTLVPGTALVTIQVADGTYAENIHVDGPLQASGTPRLDAGAKPGLVINGTGAATVLLQAVGAGGTCVKASEGGSVEVRNVRLDGQENGLHATAGGRILIGAGVVFGGAVSHIYASFGGVVISNTTEYTIDDTSSQHWRAEYYGVIVADWPTITLNGTPTIGAFAYVDYNGFIYTGATFVGSSTGVKFNIYDNGQIMTGGQGVAYLPGTLPGTFAGGDYDDIKNSQGHAVADLPVPSADTKGCHTFATDATATTFNSVVAGGGANFVPVFCDGVAWRIG